MAKAEKAVVKSVEEQFVAVFGGPMIDPTNGAVFTEYPIPAARTGWLDYQIASGKIAVAETK